MYREAAFFFSGEYTKVISPPPLGLVVKRTATNLNKNKNKNIQKSSYFP